MLDKNKVNLLQIENKINIIKYHIELLAKLFPIIIKENKKIRKSTAKELNKLCNDLDLINIEKTQIILKIKKDEKVNS